MSIKPGDIIKVFWQYQNENYVGKVVAYRSDDGTIINNPKEKIVFLHREANSNITPDTVWLCKVDIDTKPNDPYRGAYIVFPIKEKETSEVEIYDEVKETPNFAEGLKKFLDIIESGVNFGIDDLTIQNYLEDLAAFKLDKKISGTASYLLSKIKTGKYTGEIPYCSSFVQFIDNSFILIYSPDSKKNSVQEIIIGTDINKMLDEALDNQF